eukprot:3017592-Prymnesium_polylepis.1
MQGNVRNLPADQHSDNALCNPHAKWAYKQPDCVPLLHDCRPRRKENLRKYGEICLPTCGLTTPRERNKLFASRLGKTEIKFSRNK